VTPIAGKEDKEDSFAESGKVLQNPQPRRNQEQTMLPDEIRKGGTPST